MRPLPARVRSNQDFAFEGIRVGAPYVQRMKGRVGSQHAFVALGQAEIAGPKRNETCGVGEHVGEGEGVVERLRFADHLLDQVQGLVGKAPGARSPRARMIWATSRWSYWKRMTCDRSGGGA